MTIEIGKKFNKTLAYIPILGDVIEMDETREEFLFWCKREKLKVHRTFVEQNLLDYPLMHEMIAYSEPNDLILIPTLEDLFLTSMALLDCLLKLSEKQCCIYVRNENLFLNFFDPSEKQQLVNRTTLKGIENSASIEDSLKLIRMRKDLVDRKLCGKRIANKFVLTRESRKEIVSQLRSGIKINEIAKHYCVSNDKVLEVVSKYKQAELRCRI